MALVLHARRAIAGIAALCLLTGCFGAAGATEERYRVPLRLLDANGIELPRDATNTLRYALAVVPGAVFGMADRASLKQIAPEQAHLLLELDELRSWADAAAKPWHASAAEPMQITPSDVRVARVMLAGFAGEGGSNLGVGFHDLYWRRNLVLIYVDRKCSVRSDEVAAAQSGVGVRYALELPAAGFYWLRTAPGEAIEGLDPRSLSIELRPR